MKNILLIPSWYPSPGDPAAGIFIRNHAVEISKHHRVTVLYFCHSRKDAGLWWKRSVTNISSQLTEERITIRDCGKQLNNVSLFLVANWLVFRKLIGNPKYDVINLNVVYHMGVFLYPVLMWCKTRLVITEHWTGYFPEDGRYDKLNKWMKNVISAVFRKSEKVVVISGSLKKQLDELFGVADKTIIVSNVLNVPDSPRPLPSVENGKFEILTISYMDDRMKGISGLINAIEQVAKVYPGVHLTIVGGGGDLERLKEISNKKGLTGHHIDFTGPVPNSRIPDFYKAASFFVLNSNFETFNIATAEALLHGLPVVVTKCRGPEEYVDNSVGILIEKGNSTDLINAILELIRNLKRFDPGQISNIANERLMKSKLDDQLRKVFDI
jgi:L-malate glycosyltransferase